MNERRIDLVLLCTVLALAAIGVVMVYSASAVFAGKTLGDPTFFLRRQLVALAIGLLGMAAMVRLGHERLRQLGPMALLVAMVALIAIFVPGLGHAAGGARRWVHLGPVNFQPSELAKPALILYLAWSLSRKQDRMTDFKAGFLGPVLIAGIPIGLILLQPDFGTAVSLALVVCVMLFVAGARVSYLMGAGLLALPVVYHLVASTPYRMRRIMAFLDPWSTRHDAGYQVAESLISIGSGGLAGVGLGDGRQKLFFLPEAHTDFIYSIIGEELGLIGTVLIIVLFALLVWRGLKAAYAAEDAFGAYLALGLTAILGLQASLNMAVAMGLLPTKGLTLPFISYGGTSLVLSLVAAGILLAVSAGRGGYLKPEPGARR